MTTSTTSSLRAEPVQARAHATRNKIRRAGLTVILLHGYGRDGFTSALVAKEAGIPIGLFYRYYSDRRALLKDLFPEAPELVLADSPHQGLLK